MATYGSLLEEQEKLNSECPEVDRADFLVTNPKTVYKNNRPQYTRYEIITNSDLTIQDITRQRRGQTHHSYLPCLWNCGGKIHKDEDDFDYAAFKRELSRTLMNEDSD
ncbi:Hypothetical predicted protein [Octopus vulgaris]|uniref:Uncharacterized protein n=1 Tax=Octopus vulgaris TaxID=6645 RepID=A0AA36EXH5_OCTVU|nr:Hypothetical predicted protein [Octopus vulgaris]